MRSRLFLDQGHVAVVPVCVAMPIVPHVTSQLSPVQLVTVQPVAGHVTWQSSDPPQSTLHEEASAHSTWQSPLESHWTSTGPIPPCTWHSPPSVQVCVHVSVPMHAQSSLEHVSFVLQAKSRLMQRTIV
jgi:hypothetical protein